MIEGTTEERWLPIPGHEGSYEVSDLGRVRSVDRMIHTRDGDRYPRRGQILRTTCYPPGYLRVGLYHKPQLIHRLVLLAFVGPCPAGMEALHGNGDPSDNRLANLRWGSHSENQFDQVRHGTHSEASKTHCPRRHPLAGDNLNPPHLKRGGRVCRACVKAYTRIRWSIQKGLVPPDMQEESDRMYERILQGKLDGRAGRRVIGKRGVPRQRSASLDGAGPSGASPPPKRAASA